MSVSVHGNQQIFFRTVGGMKRQAWLAVLQMMARNDRSTRYHTIQQHYCAIILSRVNTQRQHRQGSSLCRHCFHRRYYGTATPYWALFFLFSFFFFPCQSSSSHTCTKPWSLCWSPTGPCHAAAVQCLRQSTQQITTEKILKDSEMAHIVRAHKGGYCVASSLTGYCLKCFEANNDEAHLILYMHQPLLWYINAMEHSQLREYSTGDFENCLQAYARVRLGQDTATPKTVLALPAHKKKGRQRNNLMVDSCRWFLVVGKARSLFYVFKLEYRLCFELHRCMNKSHLCLIKRKHSAAATGWK